MPATCNDCYNYGRNFRIKKGISPMKLKDTILLVGKSAEVRSILRDIFSDTYNIIEAANNEQGFFLFEQNINCIAAAILDIRPPKTRRKSLTVKMRETDKRGTIPIVILCEKTDAEQEIKGYEYGASDVIFKPFNESTIFHRVQTLIELSVHKNHLEVLVEEQAAVLRSSNETMVDVLSTIIEYRSIETGNHVMRIRQYTRILLEQIAETYPEYNLTPDDINSIVSTASLHDIGKISIPDSILNKPGRLTDEEFETMKSHTVNGAEILKNLNEVGDRKYLRYAYNICLYHHERWDGGGYPEGLVGDDIPICAQVTGIADVYDALTSDRVYKEAYPHITAINMILNGECGSFSPKVLECLKKVRDKFYEIYSSLSDSPADAQKGLSGDLTAPLPGPSYQMQKVDALQSVQIKYQTLLHHLNATVIEAELIKGLYHIVFNPVPDFYFPGNKATIQEALHDMIDTVVHPEDRADALALMQKSEDYFVKRGQRKYSFSFRMYMPSAGDYVPYRLTVAHVKDNIPGNAVVMLIYEPQSAAAPAEISSSELFTIAGKPHDHFYNLLGSTLVCENTNKFNIVYGAKNLFSLTGFTSREIKTHFGNRLMDMIIPEDRDYIIHQIDEQTKSGKIMELEYRMITKSGIPVWILDKSRIIADENGTEYIYSSLIDNSKSKIVQEQLVEELARNQLIINQSNDIVFELDIESDHLWCSDKWEERFGHKPLSDDYTERVYKYSHIHPDDMEKMREGITTLVNGASHIQVDVRIMNSEGIYLWNQIRATSQRDASGKVSKAIGVIVDIDKEMQSRRSLEKKAQMDALTGLFNKEATRHRITALLAESNRQSAFLIMDLDNFKAVNDTYGHLFGDNVLMETASEVRKYFRSDDIIGRIGGDEFAIYINSINDRNIISSRCQLLLETLNDMYKEMLPDISVSCSIGVALVPEHADNYIDLYHKADQALYQAKSAGKNCFRIYDASTSIAAQNLSTAINERIDSNEQPGIAGNSLLYFLFQRLYEATDKYSTIQSILEEVGIRLNVSRVYIFESNDERTELSNTFEWCNEGITPEKDNLQNLNYIDGEIAGYNEIYNERGILYCTDISTLEPRFRDVLEPQGVKSLLQCAIYDRGEFCGMIGFDECTLNRSWTHEQIDMLTILSQTIAMFLLKERDHEKLEQLKEQLKK